MSQDIPARRSKTAAGSTKACRFCRSPSAPASWCAGAESCWNNPAKSGLEQDERCDQRVLLDDECPEQGAPEVGADQAGVAERTPEYLLLDGDATTRTTHRHG